MAPGGQRIGPVSRPMPVSAASTMAPTITRSWIGRLRSVHDRTPCPMTSQASRCGCLLTAAAATRRGRVPRHTPSTASRRPDRTAVTKSW